MDPMPTTKCMAPDGSRANLEKSPEKRRREDLNRNMDGIFPTGRNVGIARTTNDCSNEHEQEKGTYANSSGDITLEKAGSTC